MTQGASVALTANPRTAQGDAQDTADLSLTLVGENDDVLAGFPVAEPAIAHPGFGDYAYVFACPIDLPTQTLRAIWSGTGDTDEGPVYGEDLIVVLAHGSVITEPGLLTVAQLKAALAGTTSLDDTSLQMLLDATAAAIAAQRGPIGGPLTEVRAGGGRVIFLRRPAASFVSVGEVNGANTTPLLGTDYQIRPSGRSVVRLPSGSRWGDSVVSVYIPVDDTAERKRMQLAMVKLDLAYSGLASQTDGSHSESQSATEYEAARWAIVTSSADTAKVP